MLSRNQVQLKTQLDGMIRRALRVSVGTHYPPEDGWTRLRARILAVRLLKVDSLLTAAEAPRVAAPVFVSRRFFSDEGFFTPGAITNWPQAEAVILGWRLTVGGLLATCRLV